MAYYPAYDSGDTLTLPNVDPPTWHDRSVQDQYRLGRQLARDFEDASFSSVPPPGAGDHTDTIGSLDVGKDANATSTKRIQLHTPMRHPTGAAPDFTMAIEHNDDTDSYEIGRARPVGAGVSFADNENDVFSFGGPESSAKKNEGRKRAAGKLDDGSSQDGGDNRKRSSDRKQRAQVVDRSMGSPAPRSSPFRTTLNFEPPAATPKRGKRLSNSSGERPAKITDYVSNSGSGGSRTSRIVNPPATSRDSEEDALSDLGSANGREWKFQRRSSMPSSPPLRRVPENVPARTEKGSSGEIPKSFKSTGEFLKELGLDGHTQTINLQTTLKALKDPGPTPRHRTKQTPQSFRTPATRQRMADPSFAIPSMPDVTDLFAGNDVTRFSAKKGAAAESHVPIDAIPIPHDSRAILTAMKLLQEKVTALEGSKAANEQKVAKLERELRRAETKYQQETRRARLAEEEMRRSRRPDSAFGGSHDGDAEAEMTRVDLMMNKLSLESTIANLRDDLEQIKQELQTAKIALRNMQDERNVHVNAIAIAIAANEDLKAANSELHGQLEQMENEIRQVEKRTARQHEEYKAREDRLKQYAREARRAAQASEEAMREAYRRDGEVAAEREAALRRQEEEERQEEEMERVRREQAKKEQDQQQRLEDRFDFRHAVDQQLKRIRPDLFVGRTEPINIPWEPAPRKATVEVEGQRRFVAMPRSQTTRKPLADEVEILPEPKEKEKERVSQAQSGRRTPGPVEQDVAAAGPSGNAFDDTTMSISPEEVRRIAKEINAERRKRKAAQAAEKARQEAERQREFQRQRDEIQQAELVRQYTTAPPVVVQTVPVAAPAVQTVSIDDSAPKKKNRKILKIVYLTDGDTTEIRNIEREIEGLKTSDIAGATPPPEIQEREHAQETQPVQQPVQQPVDEQPTVEIPAEMKPAPAVEPVADEGAAPVPGPKPAPAAPRVTFQEPTDSSLPAHIHPMIDHAGESHDPRGCTVCVRYDDLRRREEEMARENPLKDIDHSCLFPAPELEPVSKRQNTEGPEEEEATLRPSVNPQTQLERVVRQLKDEFRHLKLIYQRRSEEFMELDPAIQKKRRKAMTRELNELVAEMDAKSDQIYALYDVNEEFVEREKEQQRNYEMGDETEDLIRSLTV